MEEEHGPVEVLVANAGITKDQLLMRMSEDVFTTVVDTNFTGAFRVVKRANCAMLRAKKGRVVLVSSITGMLGAPGQGNYVAAKAGLIDFARSLARELGSRGITFNVNTPGLAEADMSAELSEERERQIAA